MGLAVAGSHRPPTLFIMSCSSAARNSKLILFKLTSTCIQLMALVFHAFLKNVFLWGKHPIYLNLVLRKTPKHLPKLSVALSSSRSHPFFSSKSAGQQLQTFKGTQSQIVFNKRENISHSTCLLRPLAWNKNRRLWAKCIWHGLIEHATTTMASNHKTTHVVVNIHSSL